MVLADEVAAVFAQDIGHVRARVPAQRAPDDFVDIIVAAFRVSQKTDGVRLRQPENRRLTERTRVDRLPPFRRREG